MNDPPRTAGRIAAMSRGIRFLAAAALVSVGLFGIVWPLPWFALSGEARVHYHTLLVLSLGSSSIVFCDLTFREAAVLWSLGTMPTGAALIACGMLAAAPSDSGRHRILTLRYHVSRLGRIVRSALRFLGVS